MRTTTGRTWVGLLAGAAALTALGTGAGQAQAASHLDKTGLANRTASSAVAPDSGLRVVSRTASEAALSQVQARVADYVATHGTRFTFGTYADAATGTIVMDTDAPAALVAALTSPPGARSAVGIVTHALRTADAFNRRDDVPAFYGGGGLSASGFLCSTGYAVQTSAGSRFMTTAGHCFADGTSVSTESGARQVGVVSNRLLASLGGGPIDVELMSGQSYAGRVFTGGVTSSSSIPVVSAGSAVAGFTNYCHSGRTTGEQCGHTASSTTAQVCTSTGCKSPVIAYTGGVVQQGGDSGGSFYAKNSSGAFIRGHVIAGNSSTGYVEPYTEVARRYGVSVVTG